MRVKYTFAENLIRLFRRYVALYRNYIDHLNSFFAYNYNS